jgi:hypothetical protein
MTKKLKPTEELMSVRVEMIGDYYAMVVFVQIPTAKDEDDEEWREVALKTAVDLIVDQYGWKNLDSTLIDVDIERQGFDFAAP